MFNESAMLEKRNANGQTEEEFFEHYKAKEYENPSVRVDLVLFRMSEDLKSLQVLLEQRGEHPYIFDWSLPGRFMKSKQSAHNVVLDELGDKIGRHDIYLEQIPAMTYPNRDPRTRTISIPYMGLIPQDMNCMLNDEECELLWFDVKLTDNSLTFLNKERGIEIKYDLIHQTKENGRLSVSNYFTALITTRALAFDHVSITLNALIKLQDEILHSNTVFALMPEKFTLPDLQKTCSIILGKEVRYKDLNAKIKSCMKDTGENGRSFTGKKNQILYKYKAS